MQSAVHTTNRTISVIYYFVMKPGPLTRAADVLWQPVMGAAAIMLLFLGRVNADVVGVHVGYFVLVAAVLSIAGCTLAPVSVEVERLKKSPNAERSGREAWLGFTRLVWFFGSMVFIGILGDVLEEHFGDSGKTTWLEAIGWLAMFWFTWFAVPWMWRSTYRWRALRCIAREPEQQGQREKERQDVEVRRAAADAKRDREEHAPNVKQATAQPAQRRTPAEACPLAGPLHDIESLTPERQVIADYSSILDQYFLDTDVKDNSVLPHDKKRIIDCYLMVMQVASDPMLLNRIQHDFLRLAEFQEGVGSDLISVLPSIPDNLRDKLQGQDRRKAILDIAREIVGHTAKHDALTARVDAEREQLQRQLLALQRKVTYKNGERDGPFVSHYSFGHKFAEGTYKDGKQEGVWTWWHESGEKSAEGTYKNGNKEGSWTWWYYRGNFRKTETYQNGKKEGVWTEWHDNGQKQSERTWKGGKKEGVETQWHTNGQKQEEGAWRNGNKEGFWTYWHESGEKSAEGICKHGLKEGVWTSWHKKGLLFKHMVTKTETYKNGVRVE